MRAFRTAALILATLMLVVVAATTAKAQTFQTLVNFDGTDGAYPMYTSLVQGADGNLYGTTSGDGAYGQGTVFKMTPAGALTTLYNFCPQSGCTDGGQPYAGLVLATDGDFYGTTYQGGAYDHGTVFKISPQGTLTTLYSFCAQPNCTDGDNPSAGLVQASNGGFYGTTLAGGTNGSGTVFKITPGGTLTTLHGFDITDGVNPSGLLVQVTNGYLYGTTQLGGAYGEGTVFKMTPAGALTTLHSFNWADGSFLVAGLVQGIDRNLYGTASWGGANGLGTVFKMTPAGTLTTLYSFDALANYADGWSPVATLVQGTDGNFYGTTAYGGTEGQYGGTVFTVTSTGTLTTLHSFTPFICCVYGGLLQATDGTFYGTTSGGGYPCGDCGTVFSLSMGLPSFVSFVRNPAKVGQTFGVLGQGFTGSTGISLNGTPISFTVKSNTLLTAAIPAGATTGYVTVTTPSATLTSDVPFRVLPQLLSFNPPSGPVGTQVTITGVSLTQTTGVGFGDQVRASFTVNADTQVTATVPPGAKTGRVGIQTLGGIAISPGMFTVTQ